MNIDTTIEPMSNAISFVVLLKFSIGAVVIAYISGFAGLYWRKKTPLVDSVILIEKESP